MSIHSIYNKALETNPVFTKHESRQMTAEEMQRLGVTEFKPARTTEGKIINPPIKHASTRKCFNLTKEQYLQRRANGESRLDIAKAFRMEQTSLESNWLRLWDIKAKPKELVAIARFRDVNQ